MLNTSKRTSYKTLAKKAKTRECMVSDDPLSEVVVDFRSRLFMYIRTKYVNKPLKDKIDGLFRAMRNLKEEEKHVFFAALAVIKMEVSMVNVRRVTYVFASPILCPYKEHLKTEREVAAKIRLEEFRNCTLEFKKDMLNVKLLERCIAALESYIISNLEGICSMYNGREWLLFPFTQGLDKGGGGLQKEHKLELNYKVAGKADMFESDKTCARLGRQSAVLSEDFDCMALFGTNFMIRKVHRGFFTYTTLKDLMETFKSTTKKNLAEKCCLMGTDYNFGLKGVGPVKALKIDASETSKLCNICLSAQSIKSDKFWNFLLG